MSRPIGYRQTDETKARISSGLKQAFAKNPRPVGVRKHSEETKAKMSGSIRKAIEEGRHPGSTGHLRKWQSKEFLRSINGGSTRRISVEARALRQRFGRYEQSARRRGFEWKLTEEFFLSLITQECWYCGTRPGQEERKCPGVVFNGIDRIDNALGYTGDNVVSCCVRCNYAKHTMGQAEFLDLVQKIAERHSNGTNACSQRVL